MNIRTQALLEFDKVREMLLQHSATSMGKEIIVRLKPNIDATIVGQRLQETEEARRLLERKIAPPFGGFRDVRDSLHRAEKLGALSPSELLAVRDTAACCRRIRNVLSKLTGEIPALRSQVILINEYKAIEDAVNRAISDDAEVLDHASTELHRLRQRVNALNGNIQRELNRILGSQYLQEPIITQRNGRFCVPVRAEARNSFKGIVHDISASGQTAFMEPMSVVELGNDLREAERLVEVEIQKILADISAIVGKYASALMASMDAVARLDAVFARAHFAQQTDSIMPVMNNDQIIDLIRARHPLLGKDAVPIDISLGENGTNSLLITGSNTGGKTVTLKTVGLLAMMAQSGLHVPADNGTRLPIFQQIFVDIGDEQSIEMSLSTFSSHMNNLVSILREAKSGALILLDEIGAGTDPTEGAALAKTILLEMHERGCMVLATTHYGELKVFAHNTEGFANASVEFDLATLKPTYRIIKGLPGSSYAFAIAQRLGLPKSMINRAKELIGEAPLAIESVLKQVEGVRRALDRERTAEVIARRESEKAARTAREQLDALEKQRSEVVEKARKQAREVLQKARADANELLDELKAAVKEAGQGKRTPSSPGVTAERKKVHQRLEAAVESVEEAIPGVREEAPEVPFLDKVEAGQMVYLPNLKLSGTSLEAGQGEDEVPVQVGIMQVRVAVNSLQEATPDNTPAIKRKKSGTISSETRMVEREINLLGKRAEDAAQELDAYLYDALASSLASVRVVHGYGTGALRNVVRDVVRGHPAVARYRAGEPKEGGAGVTIIELARPQ